MCIYVWRCSILKCFFFGIHYAGRLLTALVCEYLDWAQLTHSLKVYLPECNLVINRFFVFSLYLLLSCCFLFISVIMLLLTWHTFFFLQEKDFWKSELKEFSSKNGYDLNRNGDSPVLLDVLEGFLKFEVLEI